MNNISNIIIKAEASDSILERLSMITDESDIREHILVKSTETFLNRVGVMPSQTLIISLSGGV